MTPDRLRTLLPQRDARSYHDLPVADRLWLATLSIANGLPFAFFFLLVVFFKRMGLNNSTVTFNIAWALLPWALRPFCHYLFRKIGWSKDIWLLASELCVSGSLLLMAEAIGGDHWFQYIMALAFVLSGAAMVHNMATESSYRAITADAYPVMLRPLFIIYHALALLFGTGVLVMVAGNIEVMTRQPQYAWSLALRLAAASYALLWLWHLAMIWRRTDKDTPYDDTSDIQTWREMTGALRLFAGKKTVSIGALYFLFYLMPQGFTLLALPLFLIDSVHRGGLGMAPQECALAAGTVGVMGLCAGCLLCILLQKCHRSAQAMVPMSLCNALPALSGVLLSQTMPSSLLVVSVLLFTGYAGLGMAVTGCVSFLSYYSCGKYKWVFYSTGIALFFLSCMASAMYSGALQRYYGYPAYFTLALATCALSVVATVVLVRICFKKA